MEVLGKVGGILLFFGLEIVVVVMLVASALYSRELDRPPLWRRQGTVALQY